MSAHRKIVTTVIVLLLGVAVHWTAIAADNAAASANARVPFSSLARGLEWRGVALAEKDYTLWDVSPILGDDGKVHLFVCRWPEKNVDPAWRKSSEIAHYIGDQPEGPFTFHDVTLRGTGTNTWDKYAPSNVEVHKFGDTFALLYIANDDFHQPPHPRNQRIGMAVSKSLNGPWRKVGRDGLILEPSADTNHWTYGSQVVNPTLLPVGGKFYLYFKSLCQGQPGTVYGVAVADQLEGPYRIIGGPLTTKGVMIEDGFAFRWQDKICLISTDNHGSVTGIRGAGALWVSDDGLNFNPAWTQVAYDRIPAYFQDYNPQRVKKIYGSDPKLERPKLLFENGEPAWLYAPSGWNVTGGDRTVIHVLRVHLKPGDGPLPPPDLKQEYGYAGAWRGRHTENHGVGLGACSLIAPSWVITAAHVASKKANTPEKSDVKIEFGGESRRVDLAFCAPGADLAIAHLTQSVTNITPVALCEQVIDKDWGTFPMTWASHGRSFNVVPGIHARGDGDRIILAKGERPGQSGDSGCAFVLDLPPGTNDILVGVLHGSGFAPQPAKFRRWIDETIAAHSTEKALWRPRPEKSALKQNAE